METPRPPTPESRERTSTPALGVVPRPDGLVMALAFEASRSSLARAREALDAYLEHLEQHHADKVRVDPTLRSVQHGLERWLRIAPLDSAEAVEASVTAVTEAIESIDRNLAVRTTGGGHPGMRRVDRPGSARATVNPDDGIACGEAFFSLDGLHHRRDAITREMFRLAGIGGEEAATPLPSAVTTTAQALGSPDHLVRLVASLVDRVASFDPA